MGQEIASLASPGLAEKDFKVFIIINLYHIIRITIKGQSQGLIWQGVSGARDYKSRYAS